MGRLLSASRDHHTTCACRGRGGWQLRLRYVWVTWHAGLTVWAHIGGRKPLAHLPRWRRRLLHLPCLRWRLWPRPWNFNGPVAGYRAELQRARGHRNALWDLLHQATQELPEARRVAWLDQAEALFEPR